MTLKDCNIGDRVRVWCIGWGKFDTESGVIVDNGVSTLVKVKYRTGITMEFTPSTKCIKG